ncbi:hypothetical protein I4U23_000415 [Adineta vaga]|nr:hypothetical protein I4U23_000415 [Adineta vaga]
MKSQMLTLLLLTIGAHLLQSTHQYRPRKREITEYDLTNFIVGSCSADQVDTIIQNLCDQTLQSALMGQFPFLLFYCKEIGSGNRYCDNLNRYILAMKNVGTKRFVSRRFVRTIDENNKSSRETQENHANTDLEEKLILRLCMTKMDKSSMRVQRMCNQTLDAIEQGRYPEIKQFCKSQPGSDYCHDVLSLSSINSRPSSKESSSYFSSLRSHAPDSHLKSVPFESLKMSDVDSVIDQQRMNKNTNKLSLL